MLLHCLLGLVLQLGRGGIAGIVNFHVFSRGQDLSISMYGGVGLY